MSLLLWALLLLAQLVAAEVGLREQALLDIHEPPATAKPPPGAQTSSDSTVSLGRMDITQELVTNAIFRGGNASQGPHVLVFVVDASSSASPEDFRTIRHGLTSLVGMYRSLFGDRGKFLIVKFSSQPTILGSPFMTGSEALGAVSAMEQDRSVDVALSSALANVRDLIEPREEFAILHLLLGSNEFKSSTNPKEAQLAYKEADALLLRKNTSVYAFGIGNSEMDLTLGLLLGTGVNRELNKDGTMMVAGSVAPKYAVFPDERTFSRYVEGMARQIRGDSSVLLVSDISCHVCPGMTILDTACKSMKCKITVELFAGSDTDDTFVLQLRDRPMAGKDRLFSLNSDDRCTIDVLLKGHGSIASCSVYLKKYSPKELSDYPIYLEVGLLDRERRPLAPDVGKIAILNPMFPFPLHQYLQGYFRDPMRIVVWGLQGTGKSEWINSLVSSCGREVRYPLSTGVRTTADSSPWTTELDVISMNTYGLWNRCPFEFGDTFGMIHSRVNHTQPIYHDLMVHRLLGNLGDGYNVASFLNGSLEEHLEPGKYVPFDGLLLFLAGKGSTNEVFREKNLWPFLELVKTVTEAPGLRNFPILGIIVCKDNVGQSSCAPSVLKTWQELLKDSVVKNVFDADPYLSGPNPPGEKWKSNERDLKKWIVMSQFQYMVDNRRLVCGGCKNGGKCLISARKKECRCMRGFTGLHCEIHKPPISKKLENFLVRIQLSQYIQNFEDEEVMFEDLPDVIDDPELVVELIPKKLHQKRFLREVRRLFESDEL